ncbi:MAG: hypothetical protein LWW86_02120 [Micrococcales bacterium]|nr:hypothetical protein [Micrococcales bacterium]
MADHDWTTPEGLAAIRDALASTIEGWREPVAFGVGLTPASSSAELEFPHVNVAGSRAGLSAVVLAKAVGHPGGSATYPVTAAQLQAAIDALAPAEACAGVRHPNLAAWRTALAELEGNPARAAYAVFVGDLDDAVVDEADAAFRATFEGHAPEL